MKIAILMVELIVFLVIMLYMFVITIKRDKEQRKINRQFLNNLQIEEKILEKRLEEETKPVRKVGRPKKGAK